MKLELALKILWIVSHSSLALAATTGIILHKREPHTALLWIILVWAFPVGGFLIYWNFGSTRVLTRRRRQPLSEKPMLGGNRADLLEDGARAYPAMLQSIAQAKRRIDLMTYIFDVDRVGLLFVDAPLARQRPVA